MDSYQSTTTQQSGLPPFSSLVKARDVIGLTFLPKVSRECYAIGIDALWDQINSSLPDSDAFQRAVMRLHEITLAIKDRVSEHEAAQPSLATLASPRQEDAQLANSKQRRDGRSTQLLKSWWRRSLRAASRKRWLRSAFIRKQDI